MMHLPLCLLVYLSSPWTSSSTRPGTGWAPLFTNAQDLAQCQATMYTCIDMNTGELPSFYQCQRLLPRTLEVEIIIFNLELWCWKSTSFLERKSAIFNKIYALNHYSHTEGSVLRNSLEYGARYRKICAVCLDNNFYKETDQILIKRWHSSHLRYIHVMSYGISDIKIVIIIRFNKVRKGI